MKKLAMFAVLFFLLASLFVSAQSSEDECGFWCNVGKFLWSGEERGAVAVG